MNRTLFNPLVCLGALLALALCVNCTPLKSSRSSSTAGKFEVSNASIYEQSGEFSLLDEVVYPDRNSKPFDPRINVTNKYLTLASGTRSSRCTRCHECGFEQAWDMENYGTEEWDPKYVGEQWKPVVQRMRMLENSLINEKIADRIYSFLEEETLGEYDEAADQGATVVVDVDPNAPPAPPVRRPDRPRIN
jgi:hypothetical protein